MQIARWIIAGPRCANTAEFADQTVSIEFTLFSPLIIFDHFCRGRWKHLLAGIVVLAYFSTRKINNHTKKNNRIVCVSCGRLHLSRMEGPCTSPGPWRAQCWLAPVMFAQARRLTTSGNNYCQMERMEHETYGHHMVQCVQFLKNMKLQQDRGSFSGRQQTPALGRLLNINRSFIVVRLEKPFLFFHVFSARSDL